MHVQRKIIVFELLAEGHVPAMRWYLCRGFDIYYLSFIQSETCKSPLEVFLRYAKVKRLILEDYPYVNVSPVANAAYEVTDTMYDRLFRDRSYWINKLRGLYQNADIDLAFRKQLLNELAEYFHCQFLRVEIEKYFKAGDRVLFVPARMTDTRTTSLYESALRRSGQGQWIRAKTVSFPWWAKARGWWGMIARRWRPLAACGYTLLSSIARYSSSFARTQAREKYDFGITIMSPTREFIDGMRAVGFLLDHQRICKDSTLFIPLMKLTEEHLRYLKERGLRVALGKGPISGKIFIKLLFCEFLVLITMPFLPEWVFRVIAVLLWDYMTWNAFLEQYQIRKFITCGDFGFKHISRNILFKRDGVETWYYIDTENLGGLNFLPQDAVSFKHYFWGYLYYDRFVAWSERIARYHQEHKQKIGRYDVVGCIWSEHIRLIRKGKIPSDFPHRLKKAGCLPHYKILAVFDSSYSSSARTNYDDGIAFAEAIRRLLDDFPDLFIVWKEKKPRYRHQVAYRLLHWGSEFDRLVAYYDQMESHPRCWFPGQDSSSDEMLAACDLAISFPFTSPTVEALGARCKAIYYVPNRKFEGSFFDSIPDLVARDYGQLVALVEKLVYDTMPEAYDRYLDEHVSGRIAPYLDGMALTRFRDLLCEGELRGTE